MWYNPEHAEQYERQTYSLEGREFLIEHIIWDMLKNFSDNESAPKILRQVIREGTELPLNDLKKLYTLSLTNEVYNNLFDKYMDISHGHGTASELTNLLRTSGKKWGDPL